MPPVGSAGVGGIGQGVSGQGAAGHGAGDAQVAPPGGQQEKPPINLDKYTDKVSTWMGHTLTKCISDFLGNPGIFLG